MRLVDEVMKEARVGLHAVDISKQREVPRACRGRLVTAGLIALRLEAGA